MTSNNRNSREQSSRQQWNWEDNQSNYGRRSDRDEDRNYTDQYRERPYDTYRTNDRDWNDYNDERSHGIQDELRSQTHRTYDSDYRNSGIGYNGDYRHSGSNEHNEHYGSTRGNSYDRGNNYGRGGQTFRESNYGYGGSERNYGQGNSGGYNQSYSNWQNQGSSSNYPEDRNRNTGNYRSDMNYMRGGMDQQWDRNMNSGNYYGNPGSQSEVNPSRYSSSGYEGMSRTNRFGGSNMGTNHSMPGWGADAWDQQHRGKGPKGYQRSDERITEDINDHLSDDGRLDASGIEVTVTKGEVTLTGTVTDRDSKRRAEDIAEAISGVGNVENRLRVGKNQDISDSGRTGVAVQTSSSSAKPAQSQQDHNGASHSKAKA